MDKTAGASFAQLAARRVRYMDVSHDVFTPFCGINT
jgi:hypothetical protein